MVIDNAEQTVVLEWTNKKETVQTVKLWLIQEDWSIVGKDFTITFLPNGFLFLAKEKCLDNHLGFPIQKRTDPQTN